jgi:RNA polymerase sigma factor (TIGR02999 family)
MSEQITQLLRKWEGGDRGAFDELMPLVYGELRRLAGAYFGRHPYQVSLQPTALVHEVYLRLAEQPDLSSPNRVQFFALAATVMRRILVDHVRERRAAKRGGGAQMLSLGHAEGVGLRPEVELLAFDEALTALARIKAQYGQVVELRVFGGLTIEETAAALGVSHATVERDWRFARAWLSRELGR